MKLVSRGAVWRIVVLLVLLAVPFLYMSRCYCRGKHMMTPPITSADSLRGHMQMLAGTIGERNVNNPVSLRRAAAYIEKTWSNQGYRVERQVFTADGVECVNLAVQLNGMDEPGPVIVVGAHYDSVDGCPGANDNASGVAALLELSRVFMKQPHNCAIRFVAFVNEEPPYFQTDLMGSRIYARACRQRGDDIRAMIALETMGYYSDALGSQKYPAAVFKLLYPSRGNFIGFISNLKSRAVTHRAIASFRAHTDFPSQYCSTFERIPGVGWSDHWAFWREGYPAFMVTDTAPFRYAHYHEATDTPDKVNYDALARVTAGLCPAICELAR